MAQSLRLELGIIIQPQLIVRGEGIGHGGVNSIEQGCIAICSSHHLGEERYAWHKMALIFQRQFLQLRPPVVQNASFFFFLFSPPPTFMMTESIIGGINADGNFHRNTHCLPECDSILFIQEMEDTAGSLG